MAHIIIGSFDSYEEAGDAIKILKDQGFSQQISLISLATNDQETVEKFNDQEELIDTGAIGGSYLSATTGAISTFLDSYHTAMLSGVGDLILSGSIGDMFSASEPFHDDLETDINKIFQDIGFDENISSRLSEMVRDGRVIVFVISKPTSDYQVTSIYNQFAALDTEIAENPLADNY